MASPSDGHWFTVSRRNARSVQTTIGWIFWDPGAIRRYESRGLSAGLGYIASRCAPFAGAGAEAVIAAFGSISALAIRMVFELLSTPERFMVVWDDRNEAVDEGLALFAPEIIAPLLDFGPRFREIASELPLAGRPFAASHLGLREPDNDVVAAWHAVNFIREWRGDTHWALVASHHLSGLEASILHNAWLGYDGDWLSLSRGNSREEIDVAWSTLETKGLARQRIVTDEGRQLRDHLEDETDRISALPWRILGAQRSEEFAARFEPPCRNLLRRVDETAGLRFQPASHERTK